MVDPQAVLGSRPALQGYKVVPYCPRCGTPLSSHELAQGYQEGTSDPSVYVKFPLQDQPGTYFLVWTTTPWTLPGNVALAVGEDIDYVLVQHERRQALAGRGAAWQRSSASERGARPQVLRRAKGRELLGMHYQPLYSFLPVDAGLLLRDRRRLRQHRGRHRHRAHRPGLRRRRPGGRPAVRPAHR